MIRLQELLKKLKCLSEDLVNRADILENNRKHNAASRRNKTDEQRERHQNHDRLTRAHSRKNGSLEKYHARVTEDRVRHSE